MDNKTLNKVLSGLSDKNIRFQDLKKTLDGFWFFCENKRRSPHFFKEGIEEIINLQPLSDGKAKAYQVKQVRTVFFKYKLHKGEQDV